MFMEIVKNVTTNVKHVQILLLIVLTVLKYHIETLLITIVFAQMQNMKRLVIQYVRIVEIIVKNVQIVIFVKIVMLPISYMKTNVLNLAPILIMEMKSLNLVNHVS